MLPDQLKNYVAGQWIDPESDGQLDVENPATGECITRVPLSTPAEADRAVAAATRCGAAFPRWRRELAQLDSHAVPLETRRVDLHTLHSVERLREGTAPLLLVYEAKAQMIVVEAE